jgi:biotin operon repressor
MSVHYTSAAWKTRIPCHTTKLVLLKLADSANDQGVSWPHVETIARETGISRASVFRSIATLKNDGHLTTKKGQHGTEYCLTMRQETVSPCDLKVSPCDPESLTVRPTVYKGTVSKPNKVQLPFDDQRFVALWEAWVTHRKQLRKPLTQTTIKLQLAKLAKWGVEKSCASIQQSLEAGWQGLFDSAPQPKKFGPRPTTSDQFSI